MTQAATFTGNGISEPEFALSFEVPGAKPEKYAAIPQINFSLHIKNANPHVEIRNIALRCQIQIDSAGRRYSAEEQTLLKDLFDEPSRWSQTLRPMLWTHAGVTVPAFTGETTVDLPVACTFDFNVAATKFFAAVRDGDIPLIFQFSGTCFYIADENGALQAGQIPWSAESRYRLPAAVWQEMMDIHYPNSAWLRLRRDVFERLHKFKIRNGIPTWEQALERLLESEKENE